MIISNMMKEIVLNFISKFAGIPAIIYSSHIITICYRMMNYIVLDQMIITMKKDSTARAIEDLAVADHIANTIDIYPCFVGTIQTVKIMDTAIHNLVASFVQSKPVTAT